MPLVCIKVLRNKLNLAMWPLGAADGAGGRNPASSPALQAGKGR
jgi:hypothetical protein